MMKIQKAKAITLAVFWLLLCTACQPFFKKSVPYEANAPEKNMTDLRDNQTYSIVEVGDQVWFSQNLNYLTTGSLCFDKNKTNCAHYGRLYPTDDLATACPDGWRVPNVDDWNTLKANFAGDSIFALLDTINWKNSAPHTNASGMSFQGGGYQFQKRLFIGDGLATSIWINQINRFDEYYHVHLYGGEGTFFPQSNFRTNEVFHAHPIEGLEHRRFSIRCICEKKVPKSNE